MGLVSAVHASHYRSVCVFSLSCTTSGFIIASEAAIGLCSLVMITIIVVVFVLLLFICKSSVTSVYQKQPLELII